MAPQKSDARWLKPNVLIGRPRFCENCPIFTDHVCFPIASVSLIQCACLSETAQKEPSKLLQSCSRAKEVYNQISLVLILKREFNRKSKITEKNQQKVLEH